jgi:hypothetical protein
MTDVVAPFVLVVGEAGDWSVDAVTAELDHREVRHVRLDTADFPQRMRLSARFDGRWCGRIDVGSTTVRLEDVTAIYYRRPGDFDLPAGLSGPERRFAHAQARVGLGGVLASLPARWMNHPSALADSEYKPHQLDVAARAGLGAPLTMVTNHPDDVHSLFDDVDIVAIKPLAEPIVHEHAGHTAVYTRRLVPADLRDLGGLSATAHYLQEWVDKIYEVRITAVGDRLFPVAIHPGSAASRVDWRSDYASLRYEVIECPPGVAEGIGCYLTEFGLTFGAFDFAVDTELAYHFLECNAAIVDELVKDRA